MEKAVIDTARDDSPEFFQKDIDQTQKPAEIEFKVPHVRRRYRKSDKKVTNRYVDDMSDFRTTPKPVSKILIKKRKGQNPNESASDFYISSPVSCQKSASFDKAQPNVDLTKTNTTGVSGQWQDIRSKELDEEIAKRFKDLSDFITSENNFKKKLDVKTNQTKGN